MIGSRLCRRAWLLAVPGAAAVLIAMAAMTPRMTSGQTSPTAPTSNSSAAPALDSEVAVRMLLPAAIRDSERLPVRKFGRADMPDAPGGYIVFIATIYPIYDGLGGSTEWLLTNYLQWNGSQWLPAIANYPGVQLTKPEDIWLARNLTDITALAAPPSQAWKVFTVGYSAGPGDVTATLSSTETVAEIYDLTDATVWSRVITLRETDTGNAGYVLNHAVDVDWIYQDVDGDGIFDLVATVTDTDAVTLTGDLASAGTQLPAPGVFTSTTNEFWKWIDGVFVLQSQTPITPAAPATAPVAPAATAPAAAAGSAPPLVPVVTASPATPATAPAAAATAAPPRLVSTVAAGIAPAVTATPTTTLLPARTASPAAATAASSTASPTASPTPSPAVASPTAGSGPAG